MIVQFFDEIAWSLFKGFIAVWGLFPNILYEDFENDIA